MPLDGGNIDPRVLVLMEARQILVDDGWVPYCGARQRGYPNCAVTAITAAGGAEDDIALLVQALPRRRWWQHQWRSVPQFNDAQTSVEPILALYDRAIRSTMR